MYERPNALEHAQESERKARDEARELRGMLAKHETETRKLREALAAGEEEHRRMRAMVDRYRKENSELASERQRTAMEAVRAITGAEAFAAALIFAAERFERDGRYTLPFDGIQVSAELRALAREAMGESAPADGPEAGTVDGGS